MPCIVFKRELEAACPELPAFLSKARNQSHEVHSKETKVQLMQALNLHFTSLKTANKKIKMNPVVIVVAPAAVFLREDANLNTPDPEDFVSHRVRKEFPRLCREHTLSSVQRSNMSSSLRRRGTHSHLQREGVCHPPDREERDTLCSAKRRVSTPCIAERDTPPRHTTEGHSLLCLEKTLSLLYREGVCLFYR